MLLNYDGLNRSKNAKNKGEQKNISKEHFEKNYACQSYNLKALITILIELILFRTGTIVDDWNSTPRF